MLLEKERELVVEYGKKLITAGLTRGTGGNINVINKKESLMAISLAVWIILKPNLRCSDNGFRRRDRRWF